MSEIYIGKNGIQVVTLGEEHVIDLFGLIDEGREHLNQFDEGIADKYPDLTSVFDSVAHPARGISQFAIVSETDGVVGSINTLITTDPTDLLIRYWIGESKIGNNYGALAVSALVRGVFNRRGEIETLSARPNPKNIPIKRSLTKARFSHSGTINTPDGPKLLYERYRN